MPLCTPQDARARSARRLARLERRVTTLVASWPARLYDYETEPSPAIARWESLPLRDVLPAPRLAPVARETVADPAPPFVSRDIRGGVRMLRSQARCPIRAFCERRLHAHELTVVGTGLDRRTRGNATHHAFEWLLEDLPEQGALRAKLARVSGVAERALASEFRDARRFMRGLFAIEAERLAATLASLIELDLRRAPFRVTAIEDEQLIEIAGKRFSVRCDRIDTIRDGVAIIDYKTGEKSGSADWLKERLRDAQVPLYAASSAARVAAVAVARVRAGRASYSGVWEGGEFPQRSSALPAGRDLAGQIAHWREQIEQLVCEFAAGDVRIFAAGAEEAAGQYAPLTRCHEQLALARGSLEAW
jgi:RecB family exonuclease